ncbi:guanylate kinase-associated protein mars-like [Episyrphus balteatus]|uniref:guanylate kinase-associated protein mars-like n=1 Tax=Episyrphus balteatus TaxID=286459 RepID=UPI002485B13A|nr:guanylate kinase-associated protein mars-like [Episyrphus balteatus]
MDHLRALYKNNTFLSPKDSKRKEAHQIRAFKRSELYTSTRNISPSPNSSHKLDQPSTQTASENINNNSPRSQTPHTTDPKQTRRKAHLTRYLAWKAEKAAKTQSKENSQRPPFITNPRNGATTTLAIKKPTFGSTNHIFRPPATIQNLEFKEINSNSVRLVNGNREEIYNFVATPKKKINKPPLSKLTTKNNGPLLHPTAKPSFPSLPHPSTKPLVTKVATSSLKGSSNPPPMQPTPKPTKVLTGTLKASSFPPPLDPIKKPLVRKVPIKSTPVTRVVPSSSSKLSNQPPLIKTASKSDEQVGGPSKTTRSGVALHSNTKNNLKSQNATKKEVAAFAKPKTIVPGVKRPTFKAPKKNTTISNAFKAVNGGKRILKESNVLETPTDPNAKHSFLNMVTSTKRKSFSSKEPSANSILVEMENLVSPIDDSTTTTNPADDKKFNFIRYSFVQSEDAAKSEEEKPDEVVHVTPDKSAQPQPPTTYLSPYVSVSRGKVGMKIEKEKRNSLYMPLDKSVTESVADDATSTTARHTLATVHYYRKQLADEIARLNGQCDTWHLYKEANAHLVEDSGSDMINVTIGQTKLLITKKLKQFGDLIDRCERGVMGKVALGKGDGAKPILTEDLEGFWSMVGLQIENVDKRFANLQRWKENDWKDPDEVLPKSSSSTNKNVGNVKKIKKRKPTTTVAPNRDLQKILRNAQAAFLRKKTANGGGCDEDVILTPSKSRQVLIRDRRSRSAAATVITINTPKVIRKSSDLDETTTTPTGVISDTKILPHVSGFRKSMNLFKSALLQQTDKKSPLNCVSPLPSVSRKSILKTPGSAVRRRPKSVIFNSPTFKFTVEDKASPIEEQSTFNTQEENERMYSLRNRKIKLRKSSEIIIPK